MVSSQAVTSLGVEGAFNRINHYSLAQVREKLLMERKVDEAIIDTAISEFRKYLSLIALGHKGIGMISRDVDEVWHTFILFTRDYTDFCNEVFGRYIHHQPSVPSQPLGNEPRRLFVDAYRQNFGDLPPIWRADGGTCFSSCSTPSTNCQEPSCK